MHREPLRVRWVDEDGLERTEVLSPMDLEIRQGEEYLIARTLSDKRRRIRLAKIASARPNR
jgi:hypothetical protein